MANVLLRVTCCVFITVWLTLRLQVHQVIFYLSFETCVILLFFFHLNVNFSLFDEARVCERVSESVCVCVCVRARVFTLLY